MCTSIVVKSFASSSGDIIDPECERAFPEGNALCNAFLYEVLNLTKTLGKKSLARNLPSVVRFSKLFNELVEVLCVSLLFNTITIIYIIKLV